MSGSTLLDRVIASVDASPHGCASGRCTRHHALHKPLYTPDERARRDATPWTLVQGLMAPFQFAVFLVSLSLVIIYLGRPVIGNVVGTVQGWVQALIGLG